MPRSFLGPMSFLGGRVSLSPMFLLVVGYPGGGDSASGEGVRVSGVRASWWVGYPGLEHLGG